MAALRILSGIIILFFGRQLFWLFVGVLGFLFGVDLATYWLVGQPAWSVVAIGLVAGVICALLAVLLQRVAFGVAGFLAGGYLLQSLLLAGGYDQGRAPWAALVAAGVVGGVLAFLLMDWALIALSALTGAAVIVAGAHLVPSAAAAVFTVLSVIGIAVQAFVYRRASPSAPP
jgi:hypothetical protein